MACRVALLVLVAVWCAAAQHCDAELAAAVSPTDPNRYRQREDRCEGLYFRGVSGETLLETSLTEVYDDFAPDSARSLLIEWKAPLRADTSLRAYSLRPRVLYRMDTLRPSGSNSYKWPLEVVSTLGLAKKDIGIVAWMKYPVGQENKNVYLPLRVRKAADSAAPPTLRLVVNPGVDVSEMYLTLASVGPGGKPSQYLMKESALGYGSYPAGRPVVIPLRDPKKTGLYLARIGATFMNSAPGHRDVWFYYTAP